MTPLDAAIAWIRQGFAPVPIPHRSKRPVLNGWERLEITVDVASQYFNGAAQNVGLLLGDKFGSTDVDCDCPETITAARELLPETGLIFGRQSKPFSHYLYRSDPPVRTQQFYDPVEHATLIELRGLSSDGSIGLQTVVPPSTHETGEAVRFEEGFDGLPASIDAGVLVSAVREVAAAALLSRHWPTKGSRHHAFLALAGVLARSEWSLDDAKTFHRVRYRCLWPTNPELDAADSEVQSTFEKHSAGGEITGIPTLVARLGLFVARDVSNDRDDSRALCRPNLAKADFKGKLTAVFSPGEKFHTDAHGAGGGILGVTIPVLMMALPQGFRNENVDQETQQLLALVAEHSLCGSVQEHNGAVALHFNDAVRSSLEKISKAPVGLDLALQFHRTGRARRGFALLRSRARVRLAFLQHPPPLSDYENNPALRVRAKEIRTSARRPRKCSFIKAVVHLARFVTGRTPMPSLVSFM